jgi:zinc and cadmium transporter
MPPLLAVYSGLIVAASLVGGWLPRWLRLTHVRLQVMISFVGGLMLGAALFQMLPHAIQDLGADRATQVGLGLLVGMATMFALLRLFHFHHHDTTGVDNDRDVEAAVRHHEHDHDCDSHGPRLPARRLTWLGVFAGLALHTLLDGVALAACVESSPEPVQGWLGVGAFLAILLHKPLDAVSITSLMTASGWSLRSQTLINLAFALMCPAGALLYTLGAGALPIDGRSVAGLTLAFSCGVFLCIALSDLLPEIEFHSHHRGPLTLALVLGLALAWGVGRLEPQHLHAAPAATWTGPPAG